MNTSHLIAVYASRFRWFFFCFFFGCFGFDCLLFCSFVFFGLFSLRIRAKDRQKTQLTPLGESLPQTYALPSTALAYPRPCLAPYLCLCFFDVIMWFHNRQIYIFTFDHKTCSWFEYTYTRTHIYTHVYTHSHMTVLTVISYQQVARVCQLGTGTAAAAAAVGSVADTDVDVAPQLQLLLQLQLKVAQVGMTHPRK